MQEILNIHVFPVLLYFSDPKQQVFECAAFSKRGLIRERSHAKRLPTTKCCDLTTGFQDFRELVSTCVQSCTVAWYGLKSCLPRVALLNVAVLDLSSTVHVQGMCGIFEAKVCRLCSILVHVFC